MNSLRHLIKEVLLTERVFGAQAFVYHGSDTPPSQILDILEGDKFSPGKGSGDMYGKGLYTIYEEDKSSNTFSGRYGKYAYKLKVNLYGFVIFDAEVCQKVYGKNLSIRQQLELLGETDAIEYLASKSLDTFANQYMPKDRSFSSDGALKLKDLSKFVKGIIFTGRNDGKVVVIYDPQSVVPVAWSPTNRNIQWHKWSREEIKSSLQRSATGEFEPGKYNIDPPTALKNGRRNFDGHLDLRGFQITSLPKDLKVTGQLDLRDTQITSLPSGLYVGEALWLQGSQITSLPPDLKIDGFLDLRDTQITSLPSDFQVGEALILQDSQITFLPKGLKVGGNFGLFGTQIDSLPEDMTIGRSLWLQGSKITALPSGLKVYKQLDIRGLKITSLPADLQVGESITGFSGDKATAPVHLRDKIL